MLMSDTYRRPSLRHLFADDVSNEQRVNCCGINDKNLVDGYMEVSKTGPENEMLK